MLNRIKILNRLGGLYILGGLERLDSLGPRANIVPSPGTDMSDRIFPSSPSPSIFSSSPKHHSSNRAFKVNKVNRGLHGYNK